MRSVFVYLRDTDSSAVRRALRSGSVVQNGHGWTWNRGGDACLYIDCVPGFLEDLDPECRATITAALGTNPSVTVVADVSGRHAGDTEVRALLETLLTAFTGVAQDDYTDHAWTLAEVQSNSLVKGHTFFDYRGWYDAKRGGS